MEASYGKFLVYAPNLASRRKRLKVVRAAVEKTARRLNLNFEVVAVNGNTPVYVYYKDGIKEPVPLYCDKDEEQTLEQVCSALRSMMFVLSFHPKYSTLKKIRRALMKFS
ncbi:MAG: hypothetical protein QXK93_02210 [Candidatus Bathyarchaeia archaeon]|nr:hypothetical protein [Candidatus Bathyarchaeota archaeon]